MDTRERMKQHIEHIVRDLDHIGSVVRSTETELTATIREPLSQERLATMRAHLSEVHARLDGLREFALACERRLSGREAEEELDVWL